MYACMHACHVQRCTHWHTGTCCSHGSHTRSSIHTSARYLTTTTTTLLVTQWLCAVEVPMTRGVEGWPIHYDDDDDDNDDDDDDDDEGEKNENNDDDCDDDSDLSLTDFDK
eukprot:GHVU01018005.1.p4 GENE.GHVU01018005.1~~GHVU01018005.1.p4  ORF type:complete len:111 (+),score=21.88 GHVU01018005.1:1221-1553(+)